MATINFEQNETLTSMMLKVANVTGNDILDVAYLCSGQRPYFAFVSSSNSGTVFYTKTHPDRSTEAATVKVYMSEDGRQTYSYVGKGTQNGGTLTVTYGGAQHTCAYSATYEGSQGIFINKWAKYKPIRANGSEIMNFDDPAAVAQREFNTHFYGLSLPQITTISSFPARGFLKEYYEYKGKMQIGEISSDVYYRLRDFDGYDSEAKSSLSGSVQYDHYAQSATRLPVTIKNEEVSSASVDFGELIKAAYGAEVDIDALYPAVIARKATGTGDDDVWMVGLRYGDSTYIEALGSITEETGKYWNIPLESLPSNLGTVWEANVVLVPTVTDGSSNGLALTSLASWKMVENTGGGEEEFDFTALGYALPVPGMYFTLNGSLASSYSFRQPTIQYNSASKKYVISIPVSGSSTVVTDAYYIRLDSKVLALSINGNTATAATAFIASIVGRPHTYEIYYKDGFDNERLVSYGAVNVSI